jgi:IS30 family transposase
MGKHTTKPTITYTHLYIEEREELAIGLERGESIAAIAKRLARHRSTLSRERHRNGAPMKVMKYRANRAQLRSDQRKKESHQKEHLKRQEIRTYAENKLKKGWSPELIAGRLPQDKSQMSTNYESIYQWIYKERPDLIILLPRGHKKRRKRGSAKDKRSIKIPNRVLIDSRPSRIETREQAGHWEADTAVSRQSLAAVAVVQERKTRYCKLRKLKTKSASNMRKAITRSLQRFPSSLCKTITYDNGTENAEHEATNLALGTLSYFCRPYHSWEKGSVENCIGLLRRFYPKKTDWALLSQMDLDIVERRLNTRPKKCLGFKTPEEAFVALAL